MKVINFCNGNYKCGCPSRCSQWFRPRLDYLKSLKSRCNTLKRMGTTKPALPSPFNYFTRIDINHHFASTINRHPPITLDDLNTILSLQINLPQNIPVFNFPYFTAIERLSATSMGHDAISQQMLKLISLTVTPITLSYICNCSFATSTFLTLWRRALINPLHKTPTPLTISDTMLTSILPEQCKIVMREAFILLGRPKP